MFGSKRRIAELESELESHQLELSRALNRVTALAGTIRQMDEQIYKISQCTEFNQMRPNIQELIEGMQVRKRSESDRITSIINQELIRG